MACFIVFLYIFSCASLFVQAAPPLKITSSVEITEDMKQRERIGLECLKKTNLDRAVVEKTLNTLQFTDDPKYKDFLACSYKKQGFQNINGKMKFDNIYEFLNRFYSINDLKSLENCKSISGSTDGEIAFNTMKCIFSKIKEIEYEEDLAENKI